MSGTQKPHFAIDLNEIERQLAQAQSARSQAPSSGGRHDPLADLARIVGQDDPFESLLANDGSARPRRPAGASIDHLFAVRGDVAPDPCAQRREPAPLTLRDEFRQASARRRSEPVAISSLPEPEATTSTPTTRAATPRITTTISAAQNAGLITTMVAYQGRRAAVPARP